MSIQTIKMCDEEVFPELRRSESQQKQKPKVSIKPIILISLSVP